jgi:hypothetical protein
MILQSDSYRTLPLNKYYNYLTPEMFTAKKFCTCISTPPPQQKKKKKKKKKEKKKK